MRFLSIVAILLSPALWAQVWEQVPDFPGTARDDAAAFAFGSYAYFGTGMEVGWGLTNDWWRIDMAQSEQGWTSVPALPGSPRQYASTFQFEGDGYVFGGLDANGALNELWQFDWNSNSWIQRASLPDMGRYGCASFALNGDFFVVGGITESGTTTSDCWAYERFSDTWAQVAPLPANARHRASAFEWNGKGYVIGGADSNYTALSDCWRYDKVLDQWTMVAPLPSARYGADGISTEWAPTVIGGVSNDTTYHANAFEYDAALDTWTDLGNVLSRGIKGAATCFTSGGYYFIVHGLGIDSASVRRQEVYRTGYVFGMGEQRRMFVSLTPNPGSEHFHVDLPVGTLTELEVLSTEGRMVLSAKHQDVDASSLSPGLFHVRVRTRSGRNYNARWIKL